MAAARRFDTYAWRGGREAMLRVGPDGAPTVIVLPPLFEEANRTRTFLVGLMRRLADRGIGSVLPDLPGTGESIVPTHAATIVAMREAVADLADVLRLGRHLFTAAIRSGALLDPLALVTGRWHLAPQPGADLLRELTRTKQAELGLREALHDNWYQSGDGAAVPVEIAGNYVSSCILSELEAASTTDESVRTLRLTTDPRPADRHVAAAPLWRRSEPGDDPVLAALLADDLAAWITTCAG